MGHGLRAALVTVIIRRLLDELKPVMHEPDTFLAALNRRLRSILESTDDLIMATAFYMVVDLTEGIVRFANAGHPCPFLLKASTGKIEDLEPADAAQGRALGIFEDTVFPVAQRSFVPKDRILMTTDAVFEAESPDGHQLGVTGPAEDFSEPLFEIIG